MGAIKLLVNRSSHVFDRPGMAVYATVRRIMGIDKEWITAKIIERFGSVRQAAPHFEGRQGPMAHTSLIRLINREDGSQGREISAYELYQFAQVLGVSMEEIAKRFGIPDRWKKFNSKKRV